MKTMIHHHSRGFPRRGRCTWPALALVLCTAVAAWAPFGRANAVVAPVPLFLTKPESPIAVIDLPKDQSLFMKAYNDYSDLNGDGKLDTTYDDSIDYYGYFDTGLCYSYAGSVFTPASKADGHYCDGSTWSGNFLNWVTMSRMDVLRKILYGGKRSTDTGDETVLERAYLPTDAHAWAKYYDGDDINKLTPFPPTSALPVQSETNQAFPTQFNASGCDSGAYARLWFDTADAGTFEIGDQVKIQPATGASAYMIGGVCSVGASSISVRVDKGSVFGKPGTTSYSAWTLTDLSRTGISFCNVTPGTGMSQDEDGPPLMRVARGNYALWSANEVWQCHWREETSDQQSGFSGGFRSNGNRAAFSGLDASAENPSKSANGLGDANYVVRVKACVSGLIVNQTCKQYPDGDLKPVGLLQRYGDDGTIHFALFTGSYNRNYSGGVLRANAENFADEVNMSTDGTFTDQAHIVDTLDRLRIFGFDYDAGDHYGAGDDCTYQLTNPKSSPGEGHCRSWGNPISEIYLESLRYLAGKSPQPAFLPGSTVMGLPKETWTDPLDTTNYCSPLDVLAFNTSVPTYDDDQMSGLSDLGADQTAAALTDQIGADEGINGKSWFVGNTGTVNDDLCTAKTVSGLGEVNGICPEGPSLHGSYLLAGAAWYARTHRIRGDLGVPKEDVRSLKVDTFGVQLASNVPKISVDVGGHEVSILPAYRLDLGSSHGTGTLVDFKVIEQTPDHGRFYINWEDSNQGGDFDQDVWGILEYQVNGDSITITTDTVSASTSNPQGFGYTISGTTQDGPHFMSGILGFNYSDPTGAPGCSDCQLQDAAASATFHIGDTAAGTLKDPLYYAAKWGGFNDKNGNGVPDQSEEWDADGDGQPDNYFYATNPLGLETALNKALQGVVQTKSSAASVATNSTRLQNGTFIYQALFSSVDWHGMLLAFQLDDNGDLPAAASWDAGKLLPAPAARNIVTWTGSGGADFAWSNLSSKEQLALAIPTASLDSAAISSVLSGGTLPSDASQEGQDRLAYVTGDRTNEGVKYRVRNKDTVLGDIVNSNPIYVGSQDFGYADSSAVPGHATYADYVTAKRSKTPVIYVGANDGMLHGFNAKTGAEMLAYVPQGVYPKLSALTALDYNEHHQYLVDGSPSVVDAYFGSSWGTYLVSSLGAGGKGIFALNVTPGSSFGAGSVLWEFSSAQITTDANGTLRTPQQPSATNGYTDPSFADLGYSIPQVTAALLHDGKWAAIVANGYHSDSGTAALYLIDLQTGHLIREIDTGVKSGNGLSSPIPVDVDGDHVFDYVYAGDLKGNLWRFNLTSDNPADWSVAKLFIACSDATTTSTCDSSRQPITARPEVGAYPSGGVIVYVGTGKYFESGDQNVSTDPQTQSFYGIRDRSVVVGDATAAGATFKEVKRSDLLVQHFSEPPSGIDSGNGDTVRLASDNPIDDDYDGWVIDLPEPGERQVSTPILSLGRIIFTTLIPNTDPCGAGGDSFLIELDAFTGGRLDFSPFDVNHDQKFDNADKRTYTDAEGNRHTVYVSGIKSHVGIVGRPTIVTLSPQNGGPAKESKFLSGSLGTKPQQILENPGPRTGPQSWRQLR